MAHGAPSSRLATGEASVMELAEPFAMSQPAISKHLQVLERAGLIARGLELAAGWLVLERTFDAPWRMVYDAFTRPELVKRWFGARRGTSCACRTATTRACRASIASSPRPTAWSTPRPSTTTRAETTMIATCRYSSPEVRDAVIASGKEHGAAESYDALADVLRAAG